MGTTTSTTFTDAAPCSSVNVFFMLLLILHKVSFRKKKKKAASMADESGFDEQRKQLRWASKPLAFFLEYSSAEI